MHAERLERARGAHMFSAPSLSRASASSSTTVEPFWRLPDITSPWDDVPDGAPRDTNVARRRQLKAGELKPRTAGEIEGVARLCSGRKDRKLPVRSGVPLHDPSHIVADQGRFFVYSTSYQYADSQGRGNGYIKAWMSCGDLERWLDIGHALPTVPAWIRQRVPLNQGFLWAPSVVRIGHRWNLYYSVAAPLGPYQDAVACIGVATSPTLVPDAPGYGWRDRGPVVCSRGTGTQWLRMDGGGDDYSSIDPAVHIEHRNRTEGSVRSVWLSFGSHMSGLKVVQLELDGLSLYRGGGANRTRNATHEWHPRAGEPARPQQVWAVARHKSKGNGRISPRLATITVNAIEAPYIHQHGEWFYLYVNWDMCCIGPASSYNIRVGRSAHAEGPFVDIEGQVMQEGGGSLLLGPKDGRGGMASGHAGVLELHGGGGGGGGGVGGGGGSDGAARSLVFSSHFYDTSKEGHGVALLQMHELNYTAEGWPRLGARTTPKLVVVPECGAVSSRATG